MSYERLSAQSLGLRMGPKATGIPLYGVFFLASPFLLFLLPNSLINHHQRRVEMPVLRASQPPGVVRNCWQGARAVWCPARLRTGHVLGGPQAGKRVMEHVQGLRDPLDVQQRGVAMQVVRV